MSVNRIGILALGILLTGCAPDMSVRWTDKMGQPPETPLVQAWEAVLQVRVAMPMALDSRTETITTAATIQEAMLLESQGYRAMRGMDTNMMYGVRAEYYRWRYLVAAQPAKISYVRGFRLTDDPLGQLPSALVDFGNVGPVYLSPEPDQGIPAEWECEVYDENEIVLTALDTRMVEERIYIQLLAWGDFNHDGFDDIMLQLTYQTSGTAVYDRLAFLTRFGPDQPLCMIKPLLAVEQESNSPQICRSINEDVDGPLDEASP